MDHDCGASQTITGSLINCNDVMEKVKILETANCEESMNSNHVCTRTYFVRNRIGGFSHNIRNSIVREGITARPTWRKICEPRKLRPRYLRVLSFGQAKYITDCTIQPPDGLDKTEWEKAVSCRILRIKVSRPGVPCTGQLTGVYQHVAKSVNRMTKAQVRNTLQESLTIARRDGHRVLILGDFNAAPPKGRRGYATGSATV